MNSSAKSRIIAGSLEMLSPHANDWIFVDIGFSKDNRSCGIAIGDSKPRVIHYGDLFREIKIAIELEKDKSFVDVLIEAPLSAAFNVRGNPTGRSFEKRNAAHRYWYENAGAATLLATMYLLQKIHRKAFPTEIRLFEGFASFKQTTESSSHESDVSILRSAALGRSEEGIIMEGEELKMQRDDAIRSAFEVAGMHFGVPAVIVVE